MYHPLASVVQYIVLLWSLVMWSSFIACITSTSWTDDIIAMPHPLTTTDHLVGWFHVRGVWDGGRPIIY